jgi:chaperonin GroES
MSNTWQPLHDQILVRPLLSADRTASGLIIPDDTRERPQSGVVLAVGPGALTEMGVLAAVIVQVGDLVAFGKFAGVTFAIDGEDVLLMREREALARKLDGTFELVAHTITVGVKERVVYHEVDGRCEHCPEAPKSAFLEEARHELVDANNGPDGFSR